LDLVLGLERLSRALALLHSAELGLNSFGELLATQPPHPFHQLFHPTVGPDPESDGLLFHPWSGQVW
jgi:hypothetical protein